METTFVLLKPGIVERRVYGEIITRFERKNLKIVGMKFLHLTKNLAELHYAEHRGKSFYPDLIRYITLSPVLAMALHGTDAIARVRQLTGATKIEDAQPGTIRGDLAVSTTENVIHASDSVNSAERELKLYFSPNEITMW